MCTPVDIPKIDLLDIEFSSAAGGCGSMSSMPFGRYAHEPWVVSLVWVLRQSLDGRSFGAGTVSAFAEAWVQRGTADGQPATLVAQAEVGMVAPDHRPVPLPAHHLSPFAQNPAPPSTPRSSRAGPSNFWDQRNGPSGCFWLGQLSSSLKRYLLVRYGQNHSGERICQAASLRFVKEWGSPTFRTGRRRS